MTDENSNVNGVRLKAGFGAEVSGAATKTEVISLQGLTDQLLSEDFD